MKEKGKVGDEKWGRGRLQEQGESLLGAAWGREVGTSERGRRKG